MSKYSLNSINFEDIKKENNKKGKNNYLNTSKEINKKCSIISPEPLKNLDTMRVAR